ncbi:hypothetical protein [Persephonella sp.]
MKNRSVSSVLLIFILLFTGKTNSQETEKPYILEHRLHKHKIDIVNATVYQQIGSYSAVYSTFHLFAALDFTENDEIFINTSITYGDGITGKTERQGFPFRTTGDDLETYLRDINGTGRKHLLELFYQKKLQDTVFIAGLIDAAAFVDSNNYANDEHTQFLNEVFINNPIAPIPSYNPGIHLKHSLGKNTDISGVYIKNDPDSGWAGILEVDYSADRFNLRPYLFRVFGGTGQMGFGVSADYTPVENTGLFFRGGLSDGDYRNFYSFGMELKTTNGKNKTGIAFAQAEGRGQSVDYAVCEVYYLHTINNHLSITADVQLITVSSTYAVVGGRLYFIY